MRTTRRPELAAMFSRRQIRFTATSTYARTFAAVAVAGCIACNDGESPSAPRRVLTTIAVSVGSAAIEVGELTAASVAALDQNGDPMDVGAPAWTSDRPEIAAVNPETGLVFAIAPGSATISVTVDGKTGTRTVTVAKAPAIRINEAQPKRETSGGWVELFNPTDRPVDLSGWTMIDNNFFGPTYTFATGSVIPPNGFFVVEGKDLPFGIDGTDSAYLFSRFGVLVDVVSWPTPPAVTFGRCPDGGTRFGDTAAPTKGGPNVCPQTGALGAVRSE
jgi:hypothetical protein